MTLKRTLIFLTIIAALQANATETPFDLAKKYNYNEIVTVLTNWIHKDNE